MTSPILKSLLIRDFRSISGEWTVPLDAGIVLVHGPNGAGKTSLLSALELAATGTISYLDRLGDSGYRTNLHHRGTKSGFVTLEAQGLNAGNLGSAMVTSKGAECSPLLDDQLAQTFVERCFLPQATLGRLFEVYAPKTDRGAVTPLMRFVQEILGLNAIDALIDGLHASGHVKRVEKLSRQWRAAEASLATLRKRHNDAVSVRDAARNRVRDLRTELSRRLEIEGDDDGVEILTSAVDRFVAESAVHADESARSREALLRLDALESTLRQERLMNTDPNEPEDTSGLSAAEARLAEWRSSRSGPLLEWFTASSRGVNGTDADPVTVLRELKARLADLDGSLMEARRRLKILDDLSKRSAASRIELADLERRLGQLSASRSAASSTSAAAELASILVAVLEHVDGDECPVCSQNFMSGGSLREHVISRVESLNQDASQMLAVETLRARLESERNVLVRQLADDDAQGAQFGDRSLLDDEAQALTVGIASLRSLEPVGEAGRLALDEVTRLRATQASSIRQRTLLRGCLTDLEGVAALLQVQPPSGLLAQRIASLRAVAQGDIDEHTVEQRRAREMVRNRGELADATIRLDRDTRAVSEIQESIAKLALQIEEAKRRKESASDLRKDAERLRTATTTRVFDEHLNGSWGKIFAALVPSEPFVPQFKSIPPGSRQATVEIETVHRDGVEAASPAAMLSHGNLNTAALSLFVALHFAVSSKLPWLVFDDPVQSMDELHVSNFASLVKQLTRHNGQQVVIAVHERELFDYLALELTPASPGEELLAIELDRTFGQSVVSHERLIFSEDTALSPSPAA